MSSKVPKQPKQAKPVDVYIAVRQLNYPHVTTGENICVEPGEGVHNMAESSLALELEAGNVMVKPEVAEAKPIVAEPVIEDAIIEGKPADTASLPVTSEE